MCVWFRQCISHLSTTPCVSTVTTALIGSSQWHPFGNPFAHVYLCSWHCTLVSVGTLHKHTHAHYVLRRGSCSQGNLSLQHMKRQHALSQQRDAAVSRAHTMHVHTCSACAQLSRMHRGDHVWRVHRSSSCWGSSWVTKGGPIFGHSLVTFLAPRTHRVCMHAYSTLTPHTL